MVALAGAETFASLPSMAKRGCARAVGYVRSGQWRIDAKIYATEAEYLLCPTSGAGARLEFDE